MGGGGEGRLAPALASVLGPASGGAPRLALQAAQSHRRRRDIDWATTLARFVSAARRAVARDADRHQQ